MRYAGNVSGRSCGLRQPALAAAAGLVSLALLPAPAGAQAIGGAVTDATGGVLPGVTVEARSPALIEQVRTAVTDGSGQYRIVALESGVYSVTFTLPGFSTLVREGVELTTGFTANVDAQMAVGALEETVTVTEASPLIDVQSIEQSSTIDREVFESLPTSRTYDAMALLIPAINVQGGPTTTISVDTSGIAGKGNNRLSIHGSRAEDAETHIDGLDANLVAFEGAPEGTPFDTAIAEYVYDYSGNAAEVETGGVRLNLIPKEGSNTFSGGFYGDFAHSSWLANNIGQDLIDLNIAGGEQGGVGLDQSWYVGPSAGGPIVRDNLWFFVSYSRRRASLLPANLFPNRDTSALVYDADTGAGTVIERQDMHEGTLRLTWQATSRDKVQAYYSNNHRVQIPSLAGSQLDPIYIAAEAGSENVGGANVYQVSWVRPHTNRILFEAGVATTPAFYALFPLDRDTQLAHGTGREDLDARIDLPGAFDALSFTMSRNMAFFFSGTDAHYSTSNNAVRGSMSYVTGSHNLKFGMQLRQKRNRETFSGLGAGHDWTSVVTLGPTPIQARFDARPSAISQLTNLGVYAQEQWTIDRLTVNAGVRFDWFKGFYPDQVTEPMTWAPIPRAFPGMTVTSWKDLQPRLGIVYDLQGDGRTAIKVSASRYGARNGIAITRDVNPLTSNTQMSRSWFDGGDPFGLGLPACLPPLPAGGCVPGDGLVQGDPLNDLPNGEIVGPNTTPGFATPEITELYDEAWAFGWGTKASNWEFAASVERQLAEGVSVDFGYFRRNYVNFSVVEDRSNDEAHWDEFRITVPDDPRLPAEARGAALTLLDLNPAGLAVPDRITRSADLFGGKVRRWHGFDFNFSTRLEGVLFQGGFSTGQEVEDSCAAQASLRDIVNGEAGLVTAGRPGSPTAGVLEYCATDTGWLSQASLYGSYTLPYDVEVAGAFFSRPGTRRLAMYQVPLNEAAAALGRPTTSQNILVNVIRPGDAWSGRFSQFDFRVAKVIEMGGTANVRAAFDVHNLFNGAAVSRERYGLGPTYLQPTGLQPGRMAKVSFQLNF